MIKINDKLSFKSYSHGWELHEKVIRKRRDTGEEYEDTIVSYWSNIENLYKGARERSLRACSTMEELKEVANAS